MEHEMRKDINKFKNFLNESPQRNFDLSRVIMYHLLKNLEKIYKERFSIKVKGPESFIKVKDKNGDCIDAKLIKDLIDALNNNIANT